MNALAPELLAFIHAYLPDRDLQTMACVSRTMKAVSGDVVACRAHWRAGQLVHEAMRWVDVNEGHLVIAGSAALWWHLGCPREWVPNDVDLFFIGARGLAAKNKARHNYGPVGLQYPPDIRMMSGTAMELWNNHDHMRRVITCTVVNRGHRAVVGKLQFIMTFYWDTWQDVTGAFDLTCCMVAIDGRTANGRPRVCLHEDHTYLAAAARLPPLSCDLVNRSRQQEEIVHSYWQAQERRTRQRVLKYQSRGAAIVEFIRVDASHPCCMFAAGYIPSLIGMHSQIMYDLDLRVVFDERKAGLFHAHHLSYTLTQ